MVVDNTNATPAARAPLTDLGQRFGATITGYYFASTLAECLARNRAREGRARVPDVALYTTRKRLAPPTYAEGFDRLYFVRLVDAGGFDVAAWDETQSNQP